MEGMPRPYAGYNDHDKIKKTARYKIDLGIMFPMNTLLKRILTLLRF